LVPRLHRLLVIAESTDALLGNLFELEDLGAKDVKGISEPVGAWAAVRQSYRGRIRRLVQQLS
jgi:class 3 adenylate cyclase